MLRRWQKTFLILLILRMRCCGPFQMSSNMDTCVLLLISILLATTSAQDKAYRSDYTFNKASNAFYKLHVDTARPARAKQVCEVEGAKLMVPASNFDILQFHTLFKRYPDLGEYAWVGNDGQYHQSAEDEHPIIDLNPENYEDELPSGECDVISRKGEVETYSCYNDLPFICKIEQQDAYYDRQCGVYGKNYQYYANVASCYKIPRYVYTWSEGLEECKAEGSHLVVLNSALEHDVVWNITRSSSAVDGARASWFFFAGFRAERTTDGTPRVFRTIFNETLQEAGYNEWSENEPNNYKDSEYCGSVFKNDGKYNDLDCSHTYAFICEKEVHNTEQA